jgi:hypothetical protein
MTRTPFSAMLFVRMSWKAGPFRHNLVPVKYIKGIKSTDCMGPEASVAAPSLHIDSAVLTHGVKSEEDAIHKKSALTHCMVYLSFDSRLRHCRAHSRWEPTECCRVT